MEGLRIACVRYLNTAPLVEGLEKLGGVTLVPTVPSRIAEMVEKGEADVGLASLADFATARTALSLLPCGMIGCDGPTLTVRLYSSVPFDRVTTLHADTDSRTSVVLARLALAKLHGVRPAVAAFDARERVTPGQPPARTLEESWPETVLLIGDKVVTDHPPASRYPFEMDLGEAWLRMTGLAFMYATWMCRADEADSARIRGAMDLLDHQRRHNATRLEWIVRRRAAEARWPEDLARRYLCELLRYEVTPRAREGAERFLGEAASAGFLPAAKVEWADEAALVDADRRFKPFTE
ncbi:MAG: hypothetical protein IPM33_05305 [Phycisphaerales bacterium]|nr:hypothetical protein [Phycisphaerales bacterium]